MYISYMPCAAFGFFFMVLYFFLLLSIKEKKNQIQTFEMSCYLIQVNLFFNLY